MLFQPDRYKVSIKVSNTRFTLINWFNDSFTHFALRCDSSRALARGAAFVIVIEVFNSILFFCFKFSIPFYSSEFEVFNSILLYSVLLCQQSRLGVGKRCYCGKSPA